MAGADFEPFTLKLAGLGAFGELWWASLEESAELDALVRRLRRALADASIPFDRKAFRPHVTIIRKPTYKNDPRLGSLAVPQAETTVGRISLMLFTGGATGVIYTELLTPDNRFSLNGPDQLKHTAGRILPKSPAFLSQMLCHPDHIPHHCRRIRKNFGVEPLKDESAVRRAICIIDVSVSEWKKRLMSLA